MNTTITTTAARTVATIFLTAVAVHSLMNSGNACSQETKQINTSTGDKAACLNVWPKDDQEAAIWEPGKHCIAVNFVQHRRFGAGHSWPGAHHSLIYVKGGDVLIDLQNHTLQSEGHSSGITSDAENNKISARDFKSSFGQHSRNIAIRNGTIDLRGVGTGVSLIDGWNPYRIDQPIPQNLTNKEKTHYVLENLHIKTDNIGIVLAGSGNIVRNCVIESSGNAAIIMTGANGQILNNKIVLNNPLIPASLGSMALLDIGLSRLIQERRAPKAAIALRNAPGALVKGNYIQVVGQSATRFNIYLSDASVNTQVEDNTFVGAGPSVTLQDTSTAELTNNHVEKTWPSWWPF